MSQFRLHLGFWVACLLALGPGAAPAVAENSPPVRGITLSTHTNGSDWASERIDETMADIQAVGAGWVVIHPYAGIGGNGAVRFRSLDRDHLPEHIAEPIRAAREHNLKIALKPHLAYWGSPFRWRGDIVFESAEEWERFWRGYKSWIVMLARACPDVDGFIVGTELDQTLQHEDRWREIIAAVREETPAPLTYAANWTHFERVPFWDALDAIGIQAYFPLTDSLTVDSQAIEAGWGRIMKQLHDFSRQQGRKIVFTELGYSRSHSAPQRPWEYRVDGEEAEAVQENCLRAALNAIEREPNVVGAFLWKWFPNPYPVGRNFQLATPRLKRAISEIWRR